MKLITGLTHQPEFPKDDLTEENASLLELLLQNYQLVADAHVATEGVSWIFKVGHPSILRGSHMIYNETDRCAAIDHGVAMFETVVSMVGVIPEGGDLLTTNWMAHQIASPKEKADLEEFIDTAMDDIQSTTPHLTSVVETASRRYVHHLARYSVLGAALSRKLAIDASSD